MLGSGPRYQILSDVFVSCTSQKTHGHARIALSHAILACAILACLCVKYVQF